MKSYGARQEQLKIWTNQGQTNHVLLNCGESEDLDIQRA